MNFEYQMLGVMTLIFIVAWLPASAAKFKTYGFRWLAGNRTKLPDQPLPAWGNRVERAHINLKDNFPAFVVAILILGINQKFDECTKWAAIIYVGARLTHFIAYGFGIPSARSLGFFVGLGANIYLLAKIFV